MLRTLNPGSYRTTGVRIPPGQLSIKPFYLVMKNSIQIILILTVAGILWACFGTEDHREHYDGRVLYQGQVIDVKFSNAKELHNAQILNSHGQLYFDGEAFFEVPPIDKKKFRAELVWYETSEKGFDTADRLKLSFVVLMAGLIMLVVTGTSGQSYDDLDGYD
jgi:hypothetical protein